MRKKSEEGSERIARAIEKLAASVAAIGELLKQIIATLEELQNRL